MCGEQRDADQDEHDLRHHLRRHVDDGGREGGRRRDPAQDQRAHADQDAAELREGQYLACGIAHNAAPDEAPERRARRQREPRRAENDEQHECIEAQDCRSRPNRRCDGAQNGSEPDMQHEPNHDGEAGKRGEDDAEFHRVQFGTKRRICRIMNGTKRGRFSRLS